MSMLKDLRRAQTLARVAQTALDNALLVVAQAQREMAAAQADLAHAQERVTADKLTGVTTGADMNAAMAWNLSLAAAASACSHRLQEAAQRLDEARQAALDARVVARGRDRLVARRREALQSARLDADQRLGDELASTRSGRSH